MVRSVTRLAGSSGEVFIGYGMPAVLIGSANLPAAKAGGSNGSVGEHVNAACRAAVDQVRAGATVVEVGLACDPILEFALLPDVVAAVGKAVSVPLCISARSPRALDAALAVCPGKPVALLSDQPAEVWAMSLAVAQRHGCAVIVPTAAGNGCQECYEERVEVARQLLRESILAGVPRDDVILDLAAASEAEQPGCAALLLRLAAHLSRVDTINLALRVGTAAIGLPAPELFAAQLAARAMAAGVTCLLADARSMQQAVSYGDQMMGIVREAVAVS